MRTNFSIVTKISLTVSLIIFLTVGITTYINTKEHIRLLNQSAKKNIITIASYIGILGIENISQEYLRAILKMEWREPEYQVKILFIIVRNQMGDIIKSEIPEENKKFIKGSVYLVPFIPVDIINEEKEILGTVEIGYLMDIVIKSIARTKLKNLIIMVIVLFIGILLSIFQAHTITRPLFKLLNAMKKVGEGDFNVHLPVKQKDEIGKIIQGFNFMTSGLKEREYIKGVFSKYVAKPIAEKIFSGEIKPILTGEKVVATILYSDIRKFTELTKRKKPEDVVKILNIYFSAMTRIIFKNEGMVDKFVGDAVVAIFGIPTYQKDAPLRAIMTAVNMQETLRILNEEFDKEYQTNIKIGIGITTGEVIVGNIGSHERFEYTAIGDCMNLAGKMSKIAKEDEILIDSTTYEATKEKIKTVKKDAFFYRVEY